MRCEMGVKMKVVAIEIGTFVYLWVQLHLQLQLLLHLDFFFFYKNAFRATCLSVFVVVFLRDETVGQHFPHLVLPLLPGLLFCGRTQWHILGAWFQMQFTYFTQEVRQRSHLSALALGFTSTLALSYLPSRLIAFCLSLKALRRCTFSSSRRSTRCCNVSPVDLSASGSMRPPGLPVSPGCWVENDLTLSDIVAWLALGTPPTLCVGAYIGFLKCHIIAGLEYVAMGIGVTPGCERSVTFPSQVDDAIRMVETQNGIYAPIARVSQTPAISYG